MLFACLAFVLCGCASSSPPLVSEHFFNLEAQQGSLTSAALGKVTLGYSSGAVSNEWAGTTQDRYLLPALKDALESANIFGGDYSAPYTLAVTMERIDQGSALLGYGTHSVKLGVLYEVRDANGVLVYKNKVDSEGSNYSFGGGKRESIAKSSAAEQNVTQFVNGLTLRLHSIQGADTAANTQTVLQGAVTPSVQPINMLPQGAPAELPPVTLTSSSGEGIEFGKYYALIIGNDRYQHLPSLRSAVMDARQLEAVLRSNYGFDTTLLIDATREDILSELTRYRQTLTSNDNLLIYYAGHGWLDDEADEGYWLPVDADPDNPLHWVSNASLTSTVRAMDAKHVLVIADSCFSGKLTRGAVVRIKGSSFLARMARKRARTALTSGGLEPVLDAGGEDGHSIFASAFLQALRDNDAVVDMSQMFGVIRRQVALAADQVPEYGDIRRAGHEGGDFLFVRTR